MVSKNSVLRIIMVVALAKTSMSYADCYTRSSTVTKPSNNISRITDLEKTVLPNNKCRVTFRALIDNNWHTAEGEATSQNVDYACSMALNNGRISILEKVSNTTLTANQELICTDQKIPESKPLVKVGDMIRESEVRVHPIYQNAFLYRGSQCRWFVESIPLAGKIEVNQGIICNSPSQNAWRVVDKW